MSVREKQLWQWLLRNTARAKELHIQRIENKVGSGTPDVEGCYKGQSFWIELKIAKKPKLETTPIRAKFELFQPIWIERRYRAGGLVFILIQVGSGHKAQRFLVPGKRINDLVRGLPRNEILEYMVNGEILDLIVRRPE